MSHIHVFIVHDMGRRYFYNHINALLYMTRSTKNRESCARLFSDERKFRSVYGKNTQGLEKFEQRQFWWRKSPTVDVLVLITCYSNTDCIVVNFGLLTYATVGRHALTRIRFSSCYYYYYYYLFFFYNHRIIVFLK